MVAGCGNNFCKYAFFFVNFLVFSAGVVVLALGIWAAVDKTSFLETLSKLAISNSDTQNIPGLLQSSAYILIAVGSIIVVMSFLACCGAIRENKVMLGLFAGMVVIFMILLLAAAIVALVYRSQVWSELEKGLLEGLRVNFDDNITTVDLVSRALINAQVQFDCCGIRNFSEFSEDTKWYNDTGRAQGMKVPKACCKINKDAFYNKATWNLTDTNCPATPTLNNSNIGKSCYDSIYNELMVKLGVIIGIAFGVFCLMLLAIIFACCIIRAIGRRSDKMDMH